MDLGNIELSHPSPTIGVVAASGASSRRVGKAQRDIVALGIAAAAIIMFVGAGGSVLPQVVRAWTVGAQAPDAMLVNALLLNVALIIFGWRRYSDLTREVGERREAEQRAFVLALTDPLTGCLNRRSVGPKTDEMLAAAISRGQAEHATEATKAAASTSGQRRLDKRFDAAFGVVGLVEVDACAAIVEWHAHAGSGASNATSRWNSRTRSSISGRVSSIVR